MIDRYRSGWTIAPLLERLGGEADLADERVRTRVEAAALDLIREEDP